MALNWAGTAMTKVFWRSWAGATPVSPGALSCPVTHLSPWDGWSPASNSSLRYQQACIDLHVGPLSEMCSLRHGVEQSLTGDEAIDCTPWSMKLHSLEEQSNTDASESGMVPPKSAFWAGSAVPRQGKGAKRSELVP